MTAIHRFVEQLRDGTLSRVVARMPSGWAVLGDPQILRGDSLLVPDPVVADLNARTGAVRTLAVATISASISTTCCLFP